MNDYIIVYIRFISELVGKLEHAGEDDGEGVTTRCNYRYSTQESGEALGQVGRIESGDKGVAVDTYFGVVSEVPWQQERQPDHGWNEAVEDVGARAASEPGRWCEEQGNHGRACCAPL